MIEVGQRLETGVGHCHHTHIGVNGAERIIGAFRACIGDGIEQGRLADVGQADDS